MNLSRYCATPLHKPCNWLLIVAETELNGHCVSDSRKDTVLGFNEDVTNRFHRVVTETCRTYVRSQLASARGSSLSIRPGMELTLTLVEPLIVYCRRSPSPPSVAELRRGRSRCLHLVCYLAWCAAEAPWPPCFRGCSRVPSRTSVVSATVRLWTPLTCSSAASGLLVFCILSSFFTF